MKIAYIYYENIKKKKVNIGQALSMCSALGKRADLDFFHTFLSERSIIGALDYFKIERNFSIIKIFTLPLFYVPIVEYIGRVFFFFLVSLRLIKDNYDLIYTRDYSYLYFLNLFPFLKPGTPVFYEPHKVYSKSSEKVKSLKREIKIINKYSRALFPITGHGMDDFKEAGVIVDMTVLPCGVDLDLFQSELDRDRARDLLGLDRDSFIVLYLGSFLDWKGIDVFLKSVEFMQDPEILFLAVGAEPGEKTVYKKKLKSFHIKSTAVIETKKDRDTTIKLMRAVNIAVIPSVIASNRISERYTSPVKLFEYMAMGIPIAASDTPAIREIIDEENAVFFNPGDPRGLAEKIALMKKDVKLRKRLAENNIQKVKTYSLEKRVDTVLRKFRDVKN